MATAGVSDAQLPPGVVELKVVENPIQIAWFPLNVPGFGIAETVTVRFAVTLAQPPVPATVYTIVEVPTAIPVIIPVVAFTVATTVSEELQLPPVTVDIYVVVAATQIF